MTTLFIANTVSDLVQGDVREHLPVERIDLTGEVLGLGTTSALDNGELTFLSDRTRGRSVIYKSSPFDGTVQALASGSGLHHFPFVCYTADACAARHVVDRGWIASQPEGPLQALVGAAIEAGIRASTLGQAEIYGVRLTAEWRSLVITVASKLCMGQSRRNAQVATNTTATALGSSIYTALPHFRLAPAEDRARSAIRYLGEQLTWDCCGFWARRPEDGLVTVPTAGAHLHLHGCSVDRHVGGHLHHEHAESQWCRITALELYPVDRVTMLASDLAVEGLAYSDGQLTFTVANRGQLDTSEVGIAVVVDDRYSTHRYLRLPWLAAGAAESFSMPLGLNPGSHTVRVVVDPERDILEPGHQQRNNVASLVVN